MNSYSITNIGKRRSSNEDYVFSSDTAVGSLPNLYVVADGMGGHQAGDYASRYTVTRLVDLVRTSTRSDAQELLGRALSEVNREVRTIAAANAQYLGMGTTVVAATVRGGELLAVNVGDSRLYLYRAADKALRQVTVDHSLVEEMVLAGGIGQEDARRHPDKNIITRAVGAEDGLRPDFFTAALTEGDLVLLCTDGLTNMLEDKQIAAVLSGQETIADKAAALVQAANENGGRDNITVTLVDPFSQSRAVTEDVHD